jgi:hypothetical protein
VRCELSEFSATQFACYGCSTIGPPCQTLADLIRGSVVVPAGRGRLGGIRTLVSQLVC